MALTVVVTGANRGIGLSLCRHYKNRGAFVYGACRNSSQELEQTADVVVDGVDVGTVNGCRGLFDKMANTKIELLINNAGILGREELGHLDFDSINQQFQVNTLGALRTTEGLLGSLVAGAKVAMITSRMGSIADNGTGGRYGYRMSKAALNAASKSLAIDLHPKGIAVAILHPGFVRTDMVGGQGNCTPDVAVEQLAERIEELDLSNSGTFWHANGEELPW